METKQATRIQTSLLNGIEKKALVWLAGKQPAWMTSDILTLIGLIGSILIFCGYLLSVRNINWLWLSTFGLLVNWYGDSLDGTLARVRNKQRPLYGYYLDHMIDLVDEAFMFFGVGLSALAHLEVVLWMYVFYLWMTIGVSINAHLRSEFKLTYAKLGPTEFRVLVMLVNTLLIFIKPLREFTLPLSIGRYSISLTTLDLGIVAVGILLAAMFFTTMVKDLKYYSKIDPKR